jgi:hypothetical protein
MSRTATTVAVFTILASLHAQDTAIDRTADAILESLIPREDAPFAGMFRLIDAAEKVRTTELGSYLLSLADGKLGSPGDTREVLHRLDRFSRHGITGETAHEIDIIRRRALQLLGRHDDLAASHVFDGYASRATVIGPFGDDGDNYTGVVFPPENEFPGPETTLAGRFGPVRSRRSDRPWSLFRIHLRQPLRNRAGCFYALHQVVADRDTACYLRLFVSGSYTLFVNGEKLETFDTALDDTSAPHFIPAVLRKGHNHVLLKTCTNRTTWFGLRYTDVRGFPLRSIREFDDAPQVTPHAAHEPSLKPPARWIRAAAILEGAAAKRKGDARARLLLAAAAATDSSRENYRLVDAVMRQTPAAPRLRLALAQMLHSVRYLPDAYRRDRSRTLIEGLGDTLGDHYAVFGHRLSHLADEDKKEEAIRLLRARIAAGKAGPGSYQRLSTLYSQLGFWAEFRRHQNEWIKAIPWDARPVMSSIGFRVSSRDFRGALRLARSVVSRLPGHRAALTQLYNRAAEMGDEATARKALAAMYPRKSVETVSYLRTAAELERRLGREKAYLDLQEKVAAHPHASLATIRAATDKLFLGGRTEVANKLAARVLAEDPADVAMRRRLWRTSGRDEFPDMAPFRVDVAPLLAKFKPKARERGASSSLLLDHMIVQVFPDGSSVQEVHTLRRINDLQGVERFENARDAAAADEVVLLRTIGVDGKSYVPNRVDDGFAMPRIAPGAFIEAVYRSYELSPMPNPRRITSFYFQNRDAPFLRSEIVLILPKGHKSTIRTRHLPGEPKITRLADGKTAHVYGVRDMPRLPTEYYLPPIEDLVPMLACGEDGSHAGTARRYRAGAHSAVFVTPPIQRQAETLIAGKATDAEKAQAIHQFVHSEIVQARSSSFPTTVLLNKKGPRFWLELALLSAAKVPYRHGLCASRRKARRGQPEPFYAGTTPYSLSCARVEPKGGEAYWLFMNAPRYYPTGAIPAERFDAEAVLFDPMETLQIPAGRVRDGSGLRGKGALVLNADGSATMSVEVTIRGVVGYRIAEAMRNEVANRKKRFMRDFLGSVMRGWTLDDKFEFVGLDRHKPVTVRGTMRKRQALEPAGDDFLLRLPMRRYQLLAGFGGRAGRQLPMQLTDELSMAWQVTVDPGETYEIVELPNGIESRKLLMDYTLTYERDTENAKVTRDFMQSAGRIEAKDFDTWRQLLKSLDEAEAVSMKLHRRK